jgi:hypothetical protein
MRLRRTNLALTLAATCVVALGVAVWSGRSDAAPKKVKKPTSVSIVESVPLDVVVSNPLEATVATLPPLQIETMPAVAVASLPATTHVGRPLDDLVVLTLINPTTTPIFVRSRDDGTRDAAEFVVLAGKRLVVTDIDWHVEHNATTDYATFRVFVEKGADRCLVAFLTDPNSGPVSGSFAWGAKNLGAGFVVGAGARVVADVRASGSAAQQGTTLAPFTDTNTAIVLRGYLAQD